MSILYILLALVVLLVLITVHEFGHYCAGKIFGFKINEFSIGFGPALYKKTKKDGEVFSVRWLPLGGFCAFEGEDEDGKENPEAFNNKPAWKRLIVLLSGVTFNFLFGILTAAIYLMVTGYSVPKINSYVDPNSSFRQNDIIVAVDGKTIEAYRSFTDLVADYKEGEEFVITVDRDGKMVDITTSKEKYNPFYYVYDTSYFEGKIFNADGTKMNMDVFVNGIMQHPTTSEVGEDVGKGAALKEYFAANIYKADGTRYSDAEVEQMFKDNHFVYVGSGVSMGISFGYVGEKYGFFECFAKAWPFCFWMCGLILSALGGLFTGATPIKEMGGTVTAISQIAEYSSQSLYYLLLFFPMLSMNLALFNILPVPSLDGARAVFVLIEMIFRKPVNRKVEGYIHTIGLFLLLGMVIFFDIYHFAVAARLLI